MTKRFNVFLVPKDPRSMTGGTCCIGAAVSREQAYSVSHRFIAARYPNDQELVLELAGEESPLGALASDAADHVVVAVDADEYLVVTLI